MIGRREENGVVVDSEDGATHARTLLLPNNNDRRGWTWRCRSLLEAAVVVL
jgi:hypothetical protein